jgi:hypothetical protein
MATLPSGLSEAIEDDEDLARFLTSSRQFSAEAVRAVAFVPRPSNDETSVFRHGSEPREGLWRTARDYAIGDRTLHGAAIFKARDVRAASMEVIPSEPPPRHASIVGWAPSSSEPDVVKAQRVRQALLIAQRARLVLC